MKIKLDNFKDNRVDEFNNQTEIKFIKSESEKKKKITGSLEVFD